VAIAQAVEENPVEILVVTETIDSPPESEVSSDEWWLKTPASDTTDVTVPTEVQTASTLDETPLDVAIAQAVEENPVEILVVTETIDSPPESEVSSDEWWLITPTSDYSVYPATDTVEIAAQTEQLAVAA
jgi:hypothetical protein